MVENISYARKFEQNSNVIWRTETARRLANTAIALATKSIELREVERKPRYADGERENNVEHSYMLSLVAPELAAALELDMEYPLIAEFSKVHELLEIKTGDIPTFSISSDELEKKKRAEEAALPELLSELPPYHAQLLKRYELQQEPEARFVKFVDKLMPLLVDILGQGERLMREDYNVHTNEELHAAHAELDQRWREKFGDEFPDILALHTVLCEMFEAKFRMRL